MAEARGEQLIDALIRATQAGMVRWIPTAKLREFATSFLGKFSVVVAEIPPSCPPEAVSPVAGGALPSYELTLTDERSGTVLDRITDESVRPLLERAQSSFDAERDRAIKDILDELDQRNQTTVRPRRPPPLRSEKAG
jgi:hypothetical protein